MQEWLRLQADGKLTGPAALWMRTNRPAEELYDVRRPIRIRSTISPREPAHRATLERMRAAVTDWMTRIGDQGLINEAGDDPADVAGRRPARDRAALHRAAPHDGGSPARAESIELTAPMEVVIYVPTQGASIGYTTDDGPTREVAALHRTDSSSTAPMTLRAKAIRYGYKESAGNPSHHQVTRSSYLPLAGVPK